MLQATTPGRFLAAHNPDVGIVIYQRGYTSGQLAMQPNIPTLAHIAEEYGEAAVISWLKIQVDSVDRLLGAKAFDELARTDAARLIYAEYKSMNVANMLLFFARYRIGEYVEAVANAGGGVYRIIAALRLYTSTMKDDIARLERRRDDDRMYAQRMEWSRKAISYDEWVQERDK